MKKLFSTIAVFMIGAAANAQQSGTAGIYGAITDRQGAAIPGAAVTIVHLERNQTRTAATNEQGQYAFPLVPIGDYRISAEHPGFRTFEQKGLQVAVNDNRRLDITMDVGEVNTRIVVDAAAATVETSNATLQSTIDGRRVVEMPLNGRNLADLTLLAPGVQPANGVTGDVAPGAKAAPGGKQFSVNGSRQNNVRFTLDGGDNNDNLTNSNLPYPFPDAVEEFSVQTSGMGAEVGKSSGGAVNIVTKSGTNDYHGNAFWFVRNTEFNATNFFSRAPDRLKRNQTGGTFGGPVFKNKLFFFGGYQQTWIRRVAGDGQTLTMPQPFRNGDFSSLLRAAKPVTIIDPLTNQPFPNNVIPTGRLSAAAQNLLKWSPLPGPDGFTRYSLISADNAREYIERTDYKINDKHSLTGRYFQQDYENLRPMVPNNIHSVRNSEFEHSKSATVGHTYLASASLIADTHISLAREVGQRINPFPSDIAKLGVNVAAPANAIAVSINGTSNLDLGTSNPPATFARTNIGATHSWQWVKGRQSLVFGGELTTSRYNEYNQFQTSGAFSFNGRFAGYDQADYVLGLLSGFSQSNGEIEFRRYHYQALYAGDSIRVNRKLTVNLGLRWEPFSPITDLNDRQVQFNQQAYAAGQRSTRYKNAPAGLFYPGDTLNGETVPKAGTHGQNLLFAPRIGIAWDPAGDGKMSVRTGYGIFYDSPQLYLLNNMNLQSPFSFSVSLQDGFFDDPYRSRTQLNVFPFAGDFAPDSPFQTPFNALVLENQWHQAYTQNWNFTVERALGATWTARAGYVGTKSTHLIANYDQNAPIYDFSKTLQQNQATINQRRPRPQFQTIDTLFHGLGSNYNSLQLALNKRYGKGLSVSNSYTWSKNIDYFSSNGQITSQEMPDPFNFANSRGLSDYDRTHRFVSSILYNVPAFKTLAGSSVAGKIFGNWQFGGIVTLQSGSPFRLRSSGDRAAGAGDPRLDLIGTLELPTDRSRGAKIAQYFNTAAVTQPAPGTYGTLGRNTLRGPGYANTDATASRVIPLKFRESASLTFRAEFFNLFNRAHLANPENRFGNSAFGRIIATSADPRILQLSLKVKF
jgi:hypothetical protein